MSATAGWCLSFFPLTTKHCEQTSVRHSLCWCLWILWMERGRLPAFSCSDGVFVAQLDDISARKRGAWGKTARVTQADDRLVFSNQDCGKKERERKKKRTKGMETQDEERKRGGILLWDLGMWFSTRKQKGIWDDNTVSPARAHLTTQQAWLDNKNGECDI